MNWNELINRATTKAHKSILTTTKALFDERGFTCDEFVSGVGELTEAAAQESPHAPWDFIGRNPKGFSPAANHLCFITTRWVTQSAIEGALRSSIPMSA